MIGVVDACETSLRGGGKLMFCGNGGSAADSQHLATEMLIRLRGVGGAALLAGAGADARPRDADRRAATTTATSMVFERPLRGLGRRRRRAVRHHHLGPLAQRRPRARRRRARWGSSRSACSAGQASRRLAQCDHVLLVPDTETARIQECHIALGHAVLELLEDRLVARPI